jgi:hypothetical protein
VRAHRRQVKRLAALLGYRVEVRRTSGRTLRWRVYIVQTDVVRRVIGEGHSRREALRDAAGYAGRRRWE